MGGFNGFIMCQSYAINKSCLIILKVFLQHIVSVKCELRKRFLRKLIAAAEAAVLIYRKIFERSFLYGKISFYDCTRLSERLLLLAFLINPIFLSENFAAQAMENKNLNERELNKGVRECELEALTLVKTLSG